MNTLQRLCLLGACALLGGCALSKPSSPVSFYTLGSPPLPAETRQGPTLLVIDPVKVPAYLERSQMVTRLDDYQLSIEEFHRWAEPLETGVQRYLSTALAQHFPQTLVLEQQPARATDHALRLRVQLESFEVKPSEGLALLQARVHLSQRPQLATAETQRATFAQEIAFAYAQGPQQSLEPENYAAALNGALDQLVQALAERISQF